MQGGWGGLCSGPVWIFALCREAEDAISGIQFRVRPEDDFAIIASEGLDALFRRRPDAQEIQGHALKFVAGATLELVPEIV